jgi:PAS domain S-box-containing protein
MGEGVPGGFGGRALDASKAGAAIAEAAALHDLDTFLQRAAEIVREQLSADFALLRVQRHKRALFWAPQSGPLAADILIPGWKAFQDPRHTARVEALQAHLTPDLRLEEDPSPGQRLLRDNGVRSAAWAALNDERGGTLGYVLCGSLAANAFDEDAIEELTALARCIALQARPAILLESQDAERTLLAEESRLLTEIAEAETEPDLCALVAEGARRALAGNLAMAMVDAPGEQPPALLSAPPDALTPGLWRKARVALMSGQNTSMNERSRPEGAFVIADLADDAPTPIERFMRDDLGMRALATANRSHQWGGLGLGLAVLRKEAGPWTAAERAFLARIARVFEISVERLRRGEIAVDHNLRLERHADLLATGAELLEMLSSAEDLEESCNLISARLREFFEADHVAFGMLDLSAKSRTVLGASSGVMARPEFSARISDSDVAVYGPVAGSGMADYISDLDESADLNDAAAVLQQRGIRSLMRAPFRLSDGSVGIVTVGSLVPGQFGAPQADMLLDLCRPVGIAIDRVRLLASMARTSAALDAKTHILAALVPGATAESAGTVFVNQTIGLFRATHAVVALFDRDDVRIAGMVSDVVEPVSVREVMAGKDKEPDANWRRVVSEGEPQLVADLSALDRTPAEDALFRGGLRCIMRVPIRDSLGRVRGIVTAGSPEADMWTGGDLETFGELSASLGLVFERADLYERSEQRSAKIRALTRLLSTLSLSSAPEEVARQFATQVREYLEADAVVVYAFGSEDQRERVAFDVAPGAEVSPELFTLAEASVHGRMAAPQVIYNEAEPGSGTAWLERVAAAMGFASAACVRLDAAGEPIGMIAAGSRQREKIGNAELDILGAVAAPLGMVLERARAMTTLRLQTQRTRAILDILAALGPAESIEQVAGPVANALRMMYAADHCAIGAFEDATVRLVAVESAVTQWRIGDSLPVAALWGETPPAGPVIHVIEDLATAGALAEVSGAARDAGMRSSMRVLIGTPADALGVVTVGSRQPGRFTDFDARQLVQIVQPLAVAARYFRGRRETALRTQRLETTNRILTRLSAGGTAEHLARGFLAECRGLFACCHALAVQFDQDSGTGRILALETDILDPEPLPTEFLLEEMHSARLVRQPTPHLVSDAREEATLNVRHRDLIGRGIYSAIRAPLVVHDTVRGAVSLWGHGANCFTAEDAELLGTLTKPLALALEKASALQSLGESELKYRSLVAQADEMIFLFDPVTLRILDANAFTSQALGYTAQQLLGLTLDVVLDAPRDDIIATVAAAIGAGELHLTDTRFIRADGGASDVDAVASMVTFGGREAVLVLARDVSERKAIMRQLIQSQKMDSLGAMAGAVAHDFNNLLTTILGFAGLLKRSRNMDAEERENLALIEDAARRAADLTGRLLSFSRGGLVRFGRVDLRTVIEDTLQLAEPTLHSSLKLTRALPPDGVYVEGDAGQVQQALTNIILNARDAMPEGGEIRVRLELTGDVAVIEIADSGPGMDEETRVRIFEPFYTTKPAGSGTGLGMAITYGIIQGHHGDIAVESALGQGTKFTITLPLLQPDETPPADVFNAGEGNLVLVVDDDAMVRRTTTATLTELGYNVVEAPGGATAVEIMRARPDRFSVVLLDLVMPGMTGSETFRALTSIRPDIPVVVCTGYAADSHIDIDVKRRIAGLVQKPFTAERLSRALLAAGAQPTRPARI